MKSPSLKVLASALSLAFVGATTQVSASHSWGNYHWARTANPFTLKVGDNVTSAWDSYLVAAVADWSQSGVLDLTRVSGGAGTAKRCRATSGRVEVCNSTYGNNGWLGIAQIWASGSHITQGVVKLNDTYFNSNTYNTPAWRQMVMCQEIGHAFGLDHQDETFTNANLNTCMDYTNSPSSNQHPNQHDYDQLATIYSHLDSTSTLAASTQSAGQMPPQMADHNANERAGWGMLVAASRNGLKEVYVFDYGRGYKIVTFVTWAEGEGRGR